MRELINVWRVLYNEAVCSCLLFSVTEFFAIAMQADAVFEERPIRPRIFLALRASRDYTYS